MIPRYENKDIAKIWSEETKLLAWQKVELAVIEAKVSLGVISQNVFLKIKEILTANPVDIKWWKEKEKETNHDLQAWVEERVRHLPVELRRYFHEGMTSYDTEETAFLILLKYSISCVFNDYSELTDVLKKLTQKYRYCPMMGMTHGQHAEVQTFGKRCLTWYKEIFFAVDKLTACDEMLSYSKISGAIGNYGGVTPQIEERALRILKFGVFSGSTQILPRQIFTTTAEALSSLVSVISKIGTDIRLGARSPRPIYQEPFGKKQTGSSRMPQKKNTISSEQLEGMERMALGYLVMIMQNIRTWEERAIEQSCVERVAWPDLFHVAMRSLSVCTKIMQGLQVYPDNMMQDIIDSRGTWAAGPAKEFLREKLVTFGITTEDAYRIVQLAAFIAFKPEHNEALVLRESPPTDFAEAQRAYNMVEGWSGLKTSRASIQRVIADGALTVIPELDISGSNIQNWNCSLRTFFSTPANVEAWNNIFSLESRLEDENHLFCKIK